MARRSWTALDVLFISGDAYVDHPSFGVSLLARLLEAEGFRVGIIPQPDWRDLESFQIMGRPRLFAAISAGAMDSMVNHYTAAKKRRNNDAYSPGGRAGMRPNRAVIAYTSAIKGAFKGLPTVIGGIEASLRRLAHYDYWDNKVRRSVLVDSKADLLLYGMAESSLCSVAKHLANGEPIQSIRDLRGTAYIADMPPRESIVLPAYDVVCGDKQAYNQAFKIAADQSNPYSGKSLAQDHQGRTVVVNPPAMPLGEKQLDRIYSLPFLKRPHPKYSETIPAYEQIRFSITSHRGCCGGCAFCAIAHHQGKIIQSRSIQSITAEVDRLTRHPEFRGTVTDVGGPTANMYGMQCTSPEALTKCRRHSCLHPEICPHLKTADDKAVDLLQKLRANPAVKHLFIASGVRFDLLNHQSNYFNALVKYHVGGLLKVAPESSSPRVTKIMRKPGPEKFQQFLHRFRQKTASLEKKQAVIPYFISAHPGATLNDMIDVALFLQQNNLRVEQVQEFTPTPGSLATCIFYTGIDPYTGEQVHVPRSAQERRLQKALLLWHLPENQKDVIKALVTCHREPVMERLKIHRRREALKPQQVTRFSKKAPSRRTRKNP